MERWSQWKSKANSRRGGANGGVRPMEGWSQWRSKANGGVEPMEE